MDKQEGGGEREMGSEEKRHLKEWSTADNGRRNKEARNIWEMGAEVFCGGYPQERYRN